MYAEAFLKTLKPPQLVEIYNALSKGKIIKKFIDRPTAESKVLALLPPANGAMGDTRERLLKLLSASDVHLAFTEEQVNSQRAIEIEQTRHREREAAVKPPAPPPVSVSSGAPRPRREAQPAPAQINLRCPDCGYFAKTTVVMMAKARLVCPVSLSHGKLLTPAEREEKRGPKK